MSKKGYKQTEKHKRKISESRLKRKKVLGFLNSDETKEKMRKSHLGKIPWNKNIKTGPLSDEHKRKIRNSDSIKNRFGENNPNYKGGKPKCLDCGKEINYVSTKCRSCSKKGENNPTKRLKVREKLRKPKSEESKQKMREKTLLQIQTHPGPFKDTKPELKMKEILSSLSISFEHQFRLGNHLFDFHILNTNILIEVDGDYWHGNPKMFSKLNEMQWYQKERDIKNEIKAVNSSFRLLRFWESDILKNTEIVKEKICEVYK